MARYLTDLDSTTSADLGTDIVLVEASGVDKKMTLQSLMNLIIPTGTISPFGGSTAPDGYFMCDGQLLNRTTNSNLFAIIGTTYGIGDGSTTFNAPDFRGVFLRGAGVNGSMLKADGTAFDGGSMGDENNDVMQQITGDINSTRTSTTPALFEGAFSPGDVTANFSAIEVGVGNFIHFDSAGSPAQGGARTGDETAPANVTVNYIIKF